ncbi:hypothetical protein FZEAL_5672 [Fusarium zealandicum]|uniref:Gpi anchored serine-threonine rich protein n=1 Tax=Fusarium zealandicum TaxID=1053134 RepID=A0A8H4UJY3_9HYPO|nr:hypothetical protein FZEAL_5672 [Fusarium zealandicum]
MKFIWSLALIAAAGVSAQSTADSAPAATGSAECEAEYIVKRCLSTEEAKVRACDDQDYECLCAAHEAVATCFNNCPDDNRLGSAQGQVQIFCSQASIYRSTKTTATKTGSAAAETSGSSDATATDAEATAIHSAVDPENTNNAGNLARNTGSLLLAVAGVVAAVL